MGYFKNKKAERDAKRLRREAEEYCQEALSRKSANPAADLLTFVIGLALLATGLFLIFQHAQIGTFGAMMKMFGIGIPNGLVVLPAIVGVGMLFFCKRRIYGWIVLTLGVLFILLTIIMNLDITFPKTTMFQFFVMFGTTAIGAALTLRALFAKRN